MKNNKQFETFLYSVGGVIALLAILIAFNFIVGMGKQRIDLTDEKAFTLSKGTRAILEKLGSEVKIRFYVTQGDDMPVPLRNFAQRVEDLLEEYREAARGKIIIEKLNPEPDSDAEDSAKLDGVEAQPISQTDRIYLGLVISLVGEKATLPFLAPQRERLLEYDISRHIANVSNPSKPVVGVMSGLPVFGMPANPMMQRMGQGQGQEPWGIITELKRDFSVKEVPLNTEKIDDDVKVLVVIHPKAISDAAQFAIDQFVLRGGKLVAFLDANPFFDQSARSPMNPMQGPAEGSSLDKLLKAWGVEFDTSKVVADMTFATPMQQGLSPAVLSVTKDGISNEDILTAQVDEMLFPFAGAFSGTPVAGLKQTVLVHTTPTSQLVDRFMAQMSGEQIANEFKAGGKEHPLAIRLSGKFKTAFPQGKPAAAPDPADTNKTETAAGPSLKESGAENTVILVGDSDFIHDQVALDMATMQQLAMFGQRAVIPRGGNFPFAQGAIEMLAGDANLIQVRSRASMNRPFTVVKKMEAQAQEAYRGRIKEFNDKLQDTQRRISQLQQNKDKNQRFILSPEQQKEIENLQKTEGQTSKELKVVRKNLRRDVVALENRLKWMNILLMPLIVTGIGIALAVLKRKRTAAR